MPLLSHLTSCTPTNSNFDLANTLAAAVSEPALYRLLTFQVSNLMSLFRCLGHTKVSVMVLGFLSEYFVTRYVFTVYSCYHLTQPQAAESPLVGRPRLLIQYIRSYPPYWMSFLHPQPEDAPCRCDRDWLIMVYIYYYYCYDYYYYYYYNPMILLAIAW